MQRLHRAPPEQGDRRDGPENDTLSYGLRAGCQSRSAVATIQSTSGPSDQTQCRDRSPRIGTTSVPVDMHNTPFHASRCATRMKTQCRFAVGKCQCCQTATIRRPKHVAPPRKAAMLAGVLTLRATTRTIAPSTRGRRQKVDPQNGWDFGEQDIPDRIAASAADRAHHHGRDWRQPEFQGFFSSGHSEQRQTKSVDDCEEGFRNPFDHVEREECGERAQKGRCHDRPAPERLGRLLADQKIAHDAPAHRRREGHDDNAKGVEPFHGCNRSALNREHEGSHDIDGLQQSSMARGLVIHPVIMARLLRGSQAMGPVGRARTAPNSRLAREILSGDHDPQVRCERVTELMYRLPYIRLVPPGKLPVFSHATPPEKVK